MNKKIIIPIITILSLLSLLLWFLYYKEKTSLPVKLTICDIDYQLCISHSSYNDMTSCKIANERISRYCNKTDTENIVCNMKPSTISVSYCK